MYAVADQLPWLGKRQLICLLSFTCNYVVSVRRGFLFLLVFGWAALSHYDTLWAFHMTILNFIALSPFVRSWLFNVLLERFVLWLGTSPNSDVTLTKTYRGIYR